MTFRFEFPGFELVPDVEMSSCGSSSDPSVRSICIGFRHYVLFRVAGWAGADNPLGSTEEDLDQTLLCSPPAPLVSLDSQRQQQTHIRDYLDQDVDLFLPDFDRNQPNRTRLCLPPTASPRPFTARLMCR